MLFMIKLPLSPRASLSVIAVASAVTAGAVIAPGTASAAVSYVLLGRSNTASTQTNIANRGGTPLGLTARSGYAPLAVNSTKLVSRFNADYVNGYHASSFAKVTGKTGVIVASGFDAAICPSGTVLTGGGGLPNSSLAYSGPAPIVDSGGNVTGFNTNGWLALSSDGSTDSYSLAVCYNPTGAVPGALSSAALAKVTAKAGGSALSRYAHKVASGATPTESGTVSSSPTAPTPTTTQAPALTSR